MADRTPLVVVATETGYEIQELPTDDNLDLQSNSIVNLENLTAFGQVSVGSLIINGTEIDPTDITSGNSGSSPFKVASFSTEQRDALPNPENGDIIYNATTSTFQGYANGSWTDLS